VELRVTSHFTSREIFQLLVDCSSSASGPSARTGLSGGNMLSFSLLSVDLVEKERRRHRLRVRSVHFRLSSYHCPCRHFLNHTQILPSAALALAPRFYLASSCVSGEVARSDVLGCCFEDRSLRLQIERVLGKLLDIVLRLIRAVLCIVGF
jgi:hypothetical protein